MEAHAGLTSQGISMPVQRLLQVGTNAPKREFTGSIIRGDIIWCQDDSEAGNDNNLANAQGKAELHEQAVERQGQRLRA